MAEDELSLRRQTDRAARAKALADDPLIAECFGKIEAELISGWQNSLPKDSEGRERLFALMWASQKLRTNLAAIITDGKVAMATLNQIDAKKARA